MDTFQIKTAKNINIDQNIAHLTDRISAYLIDSFVIGLYTLSMIFLLISLDIDFRDLWSLYLIAGLPAFLYYVLLETLMDGKTIGKSLMSLRVVKIDGSKPDFASYFIRWILRIVDVVLSTGGIAVLTILIRGKGQRVGDIAAGTTVISEKKSIRLGDTLLRELAEDYKPKFSQVTMFKDREMQTIKELFDSAKRKGEHHIIVALSDRIKKVMDIRSDINPIDFVDIIIKDYNYYTQKL